MSIQEAVIAEIRARKHFEALGLRNCSDLSEEDEARQRIEYLEAEKVWRAAQSTVTTEYLLASV
jgi:hypothetical protein